MTNWSGEIEKVKSQEQAEFQAAQTQLTQGNARREGQITGELKKHYEDIIIQGFQLLDSFSIIDTLTEIKDQIIGGGEIIKNPTSFEQYKEKLLRIAPHYGLQINFINLPSENKFELSEESKNSISRVSSSIAASYTLVGPKELRFIEWRNSDGETGEYLDELHETISVLSNGINLVVLERTIPTNPNLMFEKPYPPNKAITTSYISEVAVSLDFENIRGIPKRDEAIKEKLAKICLDITKERKRVESRQDLLEEYRKNHTPKSPKRSFLSRLLGE